MSTVLTGPSSAASLEVEPAAPSRARVRALSCGTDLPLFPTTSLKLQLGRSTEASGMFSYSLSTRKCMRQTLVSLLPPRPTLRLLRPRPPLRPSSPSSPSHPPPPLPPHFNAHEKKVLTVGCPRCQLFGCAKAWNGALRTYMPRYEARYAYSPYTQESS